MSIKNLDAFHALQFTSDRSKRWSSSSGSSCKDSHGNSKIFSELYCRIEKTEITPSARDKVDYLLSYVWDDWYCAKHCASSASLTRWIGPHADSLSPQHLLSSNFFVRYIDYGDQPNAQQRRPHSGIDLVGFDLRLCNGSHRTRIGYDHLHAKFSQRVVDPTPREPGFNYYFPRLGQSLEKSFKE
jgi:hypothetical protein